MLYLFRSKAQCGNELSYATKIEPDLDLDFPTLFSPPIALMTSVYVHAGQG